MFNHLEKCDLLSDIQHGSGLLNQLQIFWQLYLIELLELLIGLGLHELYHSIYLGLSTGFGMQVFLTNLSLREFQVRYFALFYLFVVIDGFMKFKMESLLKNIQLMLEFCKAPFFFPHFSCYTSMTFLIILFVILLSMLMILLSTLSVIRHLICGNNSNWLLNLNLIPETLWTGRKWLVDFNAGKTHIISFDQSNVTGDIDVKIDGPVLEEKLSFEMLKLSFPSELDCGFYIISIAKTVSKKIGALIRSMKFVSPEVTLYLCKSTIWPCMEYYYHVWTGAPSCLLKKQMCRTVALSLAASLEILGHRRNAAGLSLSYSAEWIPI